MEVNIIHLSQNSPCKPVGEEEEEEEIVQPFSAAL